MNKPTAYEAWLSRAEELADQYAARTAEHDRIDHDRKAPEDFAQGRDACKAARSALAAHLREVPMGAWGVLVNDTAAVKFTDGHVASSLSEPEA
jgi:hypothetical protein